MIYYPTYTQWCKIVELTEIETGEDKPHQLWGKNFELDFKRNRIKVGTKVVYFDCLSEEEFKDLYNL